MHLYTERSRHLSGKNYCLSSLPNPGGLFEIRREHFYRVLSHGDEGDNGEMNVKGEIIRKRERDRFEKSE
jgi:hypothetical protein